MMPCTQCGKDAEFLLQSLIDPEVKVCEGCRAQTPTVSFTKTFHECARCRDSYGPFYSGLCGECWRISETERLERERAAVANTQKV